MLFSASQSAAKEFIRYAGAFPHSVIISRMEETEDAASEINRVLEQLEDGTRVRFECGRYLLKSPMVLRGKKRIVLDGSQSVFLQHFVRESYGEGSTDILHVESCEDVTVRNFMIDTVGPVNACGKIVRVEKDFIDVKVHPEIPFDGNEKHIWGYTHSPFGYPTYKAVLSDERDETLWDMVAGSIPCTNPRTLNIPHEKVDAQTLRVRTSRKYSFAFQPGEPICIRYAYYGPVALKFRHAHRVLVEDVHIRAFGGMCCVILPRCSDFTFNRFMVSAAEPSVHFLSSNADGIHTTGLMGKLTVKNSVFRSLGDDMINAHTHIMDVTETDGRSIRLRFNKVHGYIAENWAEPGDVLHVYDPNTLRRKRDIVVQELRGDTVYAALDDVAVGDLIVNHAYQPEIEIDSCTCYNLRSRAFVIQGARKVSVKNCEFYNVTGSAVYISCAFQKWLEGGTVENVEISNNLISGCGEPEACTSYAAVNVWVRGEFDDLHNVHKNLSIHDNVFENLSGQPVYIAAADGVTVRDNLFSQCTYDGKLIAVDSGCTECKVENNTIL